MNRTLDTGPARAIQARLRAANQAFGAAFPGPSDARQPVHTVYGGAQLFKADTAVKMGQVARRHLDAYASTVDDFADVFDLDDALAETIYARVREKLEREPVEDFRIDFEDGFGNRPDDEEDAEAVRTACEVARGLAEGTLPPFLGIRIKPFTEELAGRGIRTLDLFLTTLLDETGGRLPENFVVTLPKVTIPEHVTALVDLFELIEGARDLEAGTLRLELMVETPQSIFGNDGRAALPGLIEAAQGRCRGAHFGVYDYTALCDITAAYQHMRHPVCDFARHVMQVTLAGTGVWLSDGATNIMPVGPHRASGGEPLTPEQEQENRTVVHRAWRHAYDDTRHSLRHGIFQGWDLHPAQLAPRYAAVFAFFLESREAASRRLKAFVEQAAQATLVGDVFDDAATGQGLLGYFLRALNCGALTEAEALATGLTLDELRTRSFYRILQGRRPPALTP